MVAQISVKRWNGHIAVLGNVPCGEGRLLCCMEVNTILDGLFFLFFRPFLLLLPKHNPTFLWISLWEHQKEVGGELFLF